MSGPAASAAPNPASAAPDHETGRRSEFEAEAIPHLDALYAYALRLTRGHRALAEDVVQEAMLSAYRGWHTFRPGSNCRAWLMTIVRNQAITTFRKRARHRSDLDIDELGDRTILDRAYQEDPEGRFFEQIVDEEIVRAIDDLPDVHRETLVLSDLQGLTYAEVAEVLGVAIGTVKSRLFRARKALQDRLYRYAIENGYLKTSSEDGQLLEPAGR